MINIILDGKGMELKDGSLLKDAIPEIPPEYSVAIIRPVESSEITTGHFRIVTNEGEVITELAREQFSPQTKDLISSLFEKEDLTNLKLKWGDRYSAAFGPFSSKIKPDKKIHQYSKGDLILGCGGYDPDNSFLIFSKAPHMADHGADESGGVIGKVVSGMGVPGRWKSGSKILESKRIVSKVETGSSFTTKDRGLALEDGMEIITFISVTAMGYDQTEIDPSGSGSIEHMLLALSGNKFTVDLKSSTFISDQKLRDSIVPYEIKSPRLEGNVTVRTSGRQSGSIYIYLTDIPSSPSHTITGRVKHGIELVKLASKGDILYTKVTPDQIDLRGLRVKDAFSIAEKQEIKLECDDTNPERIIVDHNPATTLEILSEGRVSVETVPEEYVLTIRLDDTNAPRTCRIFRELTGLRWYNIGNLPVIFKYDDVVLFKPSIPQKTTINLENIPKGEVPANSIAITNDSRKGKGLIGIRKNPNKEFGPTSEPFEGTNILGTVIDSDKLEHLKEGETVYLTEAEE